MSFDPTKLIYNKQCYPEYYFKKFPYQGPGMDAIRQHWADAAKHTTPLEQLHRKKFNSVLDEINMSDNNIDNNKIDVPNSFM